MGSERLIESYDQETLKNLSNIITEIAKRSSREEDIKSQHSDLIFADKLIKDLIKTESEGELEGDGPLEKIEKILTEVLDEISGSPNTSDDVSDIKAALKLIASPRDINDLKKAGQKLINVNDRKTIDLGELSKVNKAIELLIDAINKVESSVQSGDGGDSDREDGKQNPLGKLSDLMNPPDSLDNRPKVNKKKKDRRSSDKDSEDGKDPKSINQAIKDKINDMIKKDTKGDSESKVLGSNEIKGDEDEDEIEEKDSRTPNEQKIGSKKPEDIEKALKDAGIEISDGSNAKLKDDEDSNDLSELNDAIVDANELLKALDKVKREKAKKPASGASSHGDVSNPTLSGYDFTSNPSERRYKKVKSFLFKWAKLLQGQPQPAEEYDMSAINKRLSNETNYIYGRDIETTTGENSEKVLCVLIDRSGSMDQELIKYALTELTDYLTKSKIISKIIAINYDSAIMGSGNNVFHRRNEFVKKLHLFLSLNTGSDDHIAVKRLEKIWSSDQNNLGKKIVGIINISDFQVSNLRPYNPTVYKMNPTKIGGTRLNNIPMLCLVLSSDLGAYKAYRSVHGGVVKDEKGRKIPPLKLTGIQIADGRIELIDNKISV